MARQTPPAANTTPQAQKAQDLIADYRAKVSEIRSSGKYSPEGIRDAVNALYQGTQDELIALKNQVSRQSTIRRAELRSRIFGGKVTNSADVISIRDAQDRVSTLEWSDHKKAEKLLEQAELVGDTAMSQAILQKAIDNKWASIAHKYVEHHPAQESDLEEYWASTAGGSGQNMFAAAAFYLPKPTDV